MTIREKLQTGFLFYDGGMGSMLQSAGLPAGELPERWNLTHADVIVGIHKAYYEAGADIACANTFGANALKFPAEGEFSLRAVIEGAINCAKAARAQCTHLGRPLYIALDVGPCGKLLKPFGTLDFEDAVSLFKQTIEIGVQVGVDLIAIETMNDSYETKAAVLAAKEVCDLPIFVTNVYDQSAKLMTGATPEAMVALLEGLSVDAVGMNCSLGPKQMEEIFPRLADVASLPLVVVPNAGLPRLEGDRTVYDVTPDDFADSMVTLAKAGARVLGGCCGTTPAHIAKLRERVAELIPVPLTEKRRTVISSGTHALTFDGDPRLIGERINPTGKSKLKAALREKNLSYILREAAGQQEAGAQALDINVGLPEIDEPEMMAEVVTEVQGICDLPLQIDTSDPVAMERGLRLCNGQPLVNSVNGKTAVMDAIFPLVQKYGGVVIGLTLDEDGIPATAEGRVAIAHRILDTAARYGIGAHRIIIDPLALTISADQSAALVTLETIRILHAEGIRTSLGLSNVSFGLPNREAINSTFFALALENGLSAAIMNPYSAGMMNTYHAFRALHGFDTGCMEFIEKSVALGSTATAPTAAAAVAEEGSLSLLQNAICKGLRDDTATAAKAMLESGTAPLALINEEIVPALDRVGKRFEEKTLFLPQLLMSAEAAKAAFDEVKAAMPAGENGNKYTIVIATVHGDIHDIGKNIVRTLLENYGYRMVDLGRDVPPQTIVDAAIRENARIVALSALMTTTIPAMEETIRLLREQAPDCKIAVGGAVLTQDYADKMGADFYGRDAMETVRYAESLL
ncbi:MAG: homocysteine S-methyltransferase family protein [Clostridia bacterium]|nr:homocysteine S-methyltransferase family protein [Clostridia bacterium]